MSSNPVRPEAGQNETGSLCLLSAPGGGIHYKL